MSTGSQVAKVCCVYAQSCTCRALLACAASLASFFAMTTESLNAGFRALAAFARCTATLPSSVGVSDEGVTMPPPPPWAVKGSAFTMKLEGGGAGICFFGLQI